MLYMICMSSASTHVPLLSAALDNEGCCVDFPPHTLNKSLSAPFADVFGQVLSEDVAPGLRQAVEVQSQPFGTVHPKIRAGLVLLDLDVLSVEVFQLHGHDISDALARAYKQFIDGARDALSDPRRYSVRAEGLSDLNFGVW